MLFSFIEFVSLTLIIVFDCIPFRSLWLYVHVISKHKLWDTKYQSIKVSKANSQLTYREFPMQKTQHTNAKLKTQWKNDFDNYNVSYKNNIKIIKNIFFAKSNETTKPKPNCINEKPKSKSLTLNTTNTPPNNGLGVPQAGYQSEDIQFNVNMYFNISFIYNNTNNTKMYTNKFKLTQFKAINEFVVSSFVRSWFTWVELSWAQINIHKYYLCDHN